MKKYTPFIFCAFLFLSCEKNTEFNESYSKYVNRIDSINFSTVELEMDSIYTNYSARTNGRSYILYDKANEQFLRFNKDYNFENAFGSKGAGPFEFKNFSAYHYAVNGDLYLYDQGSSKILKYGRHSENNSEFFIKEKAVDIAVDGRGNVLVYHLTAGMPHVLTLYNKTGKQIKEFFIPEDQRFKKFVFRFKDGMVQYKATSDKFYFLYPNSFDIYEISNIGTITDTLSFSGKSSFSNKVKPMPDNLDPFSLSPAHWQYWASFYHPHRFYLIGEDHILFANVKLEIKDNGNEWTTFYNLYSFCGNTMFEGVLLPKNMRVNNGLRDGILLHQGDVLMKMYFKF